MSERRTGSGEAGAALVIVLALAAVLAVVIVSFTASSTKESTASKQVTSSVLSEEIIGTALGTFLGDLKQEMMAGSVLVQSNTGSTLPILYPATPLTAVPDRTLVSADALTQSSPPNLVKQSAQGRPFYDAGRKFGGQPAFPLAYKYPVQGRASGLPSSQGASGAVSIARWNKPLLLPRANPASDFDFTPLTKGLMAFGSRGGVASLPWIWSPPNWVFLNKDGTSPLTFKASESANIIGRYAYQVYDVGGLLDLNVAGYDPDASVTGDARAAYRSNVGFAELRELGFSATALKTLVAFRNPATLSELDRPPFMNRYANYLFSGSSNQGFLRVAGGASNGQTNRAFGSRAGMMEYVRQLGTSSAEKAALTEALQSLTHYSRALEQPSFRPGFRDTASDVTRTKFVRPRVVPPAGRVDDTLYSMNSVPSAGPDESALGATNIRRQWPFFFPYDMALGNNRGGNDKWGTLAERFSGSSDSREWQDVINPGFLEVRVLTGFKRFDGSNAIPGETLVKKRFPLSRLGWITRNGPSAEQAAGSALFNPDGTAEAIHRCFGLRWMTDKETNVKYWGYDHGAPESAGPQMFRSREIKSIFDLEELAQAGGVGDNMRPREPDFFELLKASIAVGSVGKSSMIRHTVWAGLEPAVLQQVRDRASDLQIFEIGLNLIDQADADSFPTPLRVKNMAADKGMDRDHPGTEFSPPLYELAGVEDLPYLYRLHIRAVEDARDSPSPANVGGSPVLGPTEVLDPVGNLPGFKPGTTAVLGIPELWNPHASSSTTYDGPKNFRLTASSETPKSIGDTMLTGALRYSKISSLLDAGKAQWVRLYLDGLGGGFVLRPQAHFAFENGLPDNPGIGMFKNAKTFLWMDAIRTERNWNETFQVGEISGPWNPATQSFGWSRTFPYDSVLPKIGVRNRFPEYGSPNPGRGEDWRIARTPFWNLNSGIAGFNGILKPARLAGDLVSSLGVEKPVEYEGATMSLALIANLPVRASSVSGVQEFDWLEPFDAATRPTGSKGLEGWPVRMLSFPTAPSTAFGDCRSDEKTFPSNARSGQYPQAIPALFGLSNPPIFGVSLQRERVDLGLRLGGYDPIQLSTFNPGRNYPNGWADRPDILASPMSQWPPNVDQFFAVRKPGASDVMSDFVPYRFQSIPSGRQPIPVRYPRTFDPRVTKFAANYHVDGGPQSFQSGAPVPNMYPMYYPWAFALTGDPRIQRVIVDTDPNKPVTGASGAATISDPPGSDPFRLGQYMSQGGGWDVRAQNRVIDLRGTEMLFSLGNSDLFREPTALAMPGYPAGSNFRAGQSNFFSGSGYSGGVTDQFGQTWLGFSFGEVPTRPLMVSKVTATRGYEKASTWGSISDSATPSYMYKTSSSFGRRFRTSDTTMNLAVDFPVNFPVDLATDGFGLTELSGQLSLDSAGKFTGGGAGQEPNRDPYSRFFLVPFNVAGVSTADAGTETSPWGGTIYLTLRLEYQDPSSPTGWSMYSERYVEVDGTSDWRKGALAPIGGKGSVTFVNQGGKAQDPQGKVNWVRQEKPLGVGVGFVTSYDPRTSRFGNPTRASSLDPRVITSDNPRYRQNFQPKKTDSDLGRNMLLSPTGGGKSDRPQPEYIAAGQASVYPDATTTKEKGPATFNMEIITTDPNQRGSDMKRQFRIFTGAEAPGAWEVDAGKSLVRWWATAKSPTGRMLYQYPSPSSYDYGWFPHAYDTSLMGNGGSRRSWREGDPSGSAATIPNFFYDNSDQNHWACANRVGMYSENIMPSESSSDDPNAPYRQAYSDPDDVVRRASGAHASVGGFTEGQGLPMSKSAGDAALSAENRPVVLNRPFQSVGEMGYAFRGSPWKNVSFSTAESGDAALLDVFCISEPPPIPVTGRTMASTSTVESSQPLVAGKVNLNTRQQPVLKALLSGALKDETSKSIVLSRIEASEVAHALIRRTMGILPWLGPLTNVAELVGKLFARDAGDGAFRKTDPVYTSKVPRTRTEPNRNPDMSKGEDSLSWHFTGFSEDLVKSGVLSDSKDWKVHRRQEAILRALAGAGQTRVWNLMMDVIVQSGQVPTGGRDFTNFVRNAESRAWIFLAIDRLTGEVLDKRIEMVSE